MDSTLSERNGVIPSSLHELPWCRTCTPKQASFPSPMSAPLYSQPGPELPNSTPSASWNGAYASLRVAVIPPPPPSPRVTGPRAPPSTYPAKKMRLPPSPLPHYPTPENQISPCRAAPRLPPLQGFPLHPPNHIHFRRLHTHLYPLTPAAQGSQTYTKNNNNRALTTLDGWPDLGQYSNHPLDLQGLAKGSGHQGGAGAGLCPWLKPPEGESV